MLEEHRPTRALCIDGFNASVQSFISLPIKDFFQKAEYLHLKHLKGGYKNLIPSMDPEGMNQLIFLQLEDCPEIECLFDSSNVDLLQTEDAFSSLVILRLSFLDNLEEVFHDPSSRCSLKNLEELSIEYCRQLYNISFPKNSKLCHLKFLTIGNCSMLTSLFKPSIVQTLELLEVLSISYCSELKQIIEEMEEGNVDYVSSQSHTSLMLPKLRTLTIYRCHSLEYIFPVCFAAGLVSLEQMNIQDCNVLKYVFGNEKERNLSVYQHQSHRRTKVDINLLNLGELHLESLPNLVGIWPSYCCPRFPNLEKLICKDCPRLSNFFLHMVVIDSNLQPDKTPMEKEILWLIATMFNQLNDQMIAPELKDVLKLKYLNLNDIVGVKGIFQFQISEPGSIRELVPLNMGLVDLTLFDLPELKFIWKGPTNFLSLQMLGMIYVNGCPKLKTISSPTILRSLPMLNTLRITNCEELEHIFDSGDAQELKCLYTCSQQVCFPNLEWIEVHNCNKLNCLFYNFAAGHFPSLVELDIEECSQLEKVFAFEHEAGDDGQEGTGKDGEQVLLCNLTYITFTSLPNFKEIHHGFKLTDQVEQTITDCPKYAPSLYLYPEEEMEWSGQCSSD